MYDLSSFTGPPLLLLGRLVTTSLQHQDVSQSYLVDGPRDRRSGIYTRLHPGSISPTARGTCASVTMCKPLPLNDARILRAHTLGASSRRLLCYAAVSLCRRWSADALGIPWAQSCQQAHGVKAQGLPRNVGLDLGGPATIRHLGMFQRAMHWDP